MMMNVSGRGFFISCLLFFSNSVSALTRTIVGWQFNHVINFITAQQKEGKERSYIVPHRSREYKHRWHYIQFSQYVSPNHAYNCNGSNSAMSLILLQHNKKKGKEREFQLFLVVPANTNVVDYIYSFCKCFSANHESMERWQLINDVLYSSIVINSITAHQRKGVLLFFMRREHNDVNYYMQFCNDVSEGTTNQW